MYTQESSITACTHEGTGFFLEQHSEALIVDEAHLDVLRMHLPKQPCYLDRSRRKSGKLVFSWRLVVPSTVLERAWVGEA